MNSFSFFAFVCALVSVAAFGTFNKMGLLTIHLLPLVPQKFNELFDRYEANIVTQSIISLFFSVMHCFRCSSAFGRPLHCGCPCFSFGVVYGEGNRQEGENEESM
jgi:hypothetical protein